MKFEAIVATYKDVTFRAAYQILKNYEDTTDIVMETFEELYIFLNNGGHTNNVKAWLLARAKSRSVDFIRKFYKFKFAELEEIAQENGFENSSELNIFCGQMLSNLYKHNPKWYWAMNDHYILGMTYEEIAAATGVSTAVIKTRVYRGREYLKSKYGDSWRDYITTCVLTLFMVIQYILLYNHYKIHGGIV